MFSDDTEQTLLLAASIGRFPDDIPAMQRDFARKLKWWLAALPADQKSGVHSAANGGMTDA
jgi:ADP-ribosylglycohydrolase